MLIVAVRKLSESSYKRSRNPVKIYPADTGLCRRVASEDAGRILETIVFIELARRGGEVFYFEEKQECDFVVKGGEGAGFAAFQVCLELTDENRNRETGGLIAACRHLNTAEGTILTDDQEWEEEPEGIKISVRPVWRWLI